MPLSNIAVVVPTVRPEQLETFKESWLPLFEKHNVSTIYIHDGDDPVIEFTRATYLGGSKINASGRLSDYPPEVRRLIYNKNDGVRNLGFYLASLFPQFEYIITLDDDVSPAGDTIAQHLKVLSSKTNISWYSTATEYMRGFPYNAREGDTEVVLSHGVWEGVKDWDAPTQLINGNRDVLFPNSAIPKGVFYPMCGMNIAFKRKLLPYMYFAPMGPKVGLDRFADIWCGIESKKVIDEMGWAVVTGAALVFHERASNVFKNLQKEARGLELNEQFWKGEATDPYFKLYARKRKQWEKLIKPLSDIREFEVESK